MNSKIVEQISKIIENLGPVIIKDKVRLRELLIEDFEEFKNEIDFILLPLNFNSITSLIDCEFEEVDYYNYVKLIFELKNNLPFKNFYANALVNTWFYLLNKRSVILNIENGIDEYKEKAIKGDLIAQKVLGLLFESNNELLFDISEAIKFYEMAVNLLDDDAMFRLGYLYETAFANYNEAIKYYEMAANKDNAIAQYFLALMYYHGKGVKKDVYKAFEIFKQSAIAGYDNSQYYLGLLYKTGEFVIKNESEAIKWFTLAALQGHRESQANLGEMYKEGLGVKVNFNKSYKWYNFAAEQKDVYALTNLGNIFYKGEIVNKDYEKAFYYYNLAAKDGYSQAMYYLGNLYLFGYGVEKDYSEAKIWYERAYKKGNYEALCQIAYMYAEGLGVKKDINNAIKYYEQATKHKVGHAHISLGYIYEFGKDIDIDYEKAFKHYKKAVTYKVDGSYLNVARFYLYGIGRKKNITEAIENFTIGAKNHDANCAFSLAILFKYGKVIKRDRKQAKFYLKLTKVLDKSTELNLNTNNANILCCIGDRYYYGIGVKKNYLKAIKYYEDATKQNHLVAMINLIYIYQKGKGVKKNKETALKYLKKVRDLGVSL